MGGRSLQLPVLYVGHATMRNDAAYLSAFACLCRAFCSLIRRRLGARA